MSFHSYKMHRYMVQLRWIIALVILTGGADVASGQLDIEYTWGEMHCPPDDVQMMANQVPWGVEGRAYKTVPHGLAIAPSKIPNAGFGVFAETFIQRYTWLGEYEGDVIGLKHNDSISWYTWTVHRGGSPMAFLDGYHFHTSSYHRYFNTPLLFRDQNVIPLECYGKIYYMTSRDIAPGEELLIFYGYDYAENLSIDLNDYFEVAVELRAGGLDLNRPAHQQAVEQAGFDLYETKDLPASWLPVFLDEDY